MSFAQFDEELLIAYSKQFITQNLHKMLVYDLHSLINMIEEIKDIIQIYILMETIGDKIEIPIPIINSHFTDNEIIKMFDDHINHWSENTISHIIVANYYLRKILNLELFKLVHYKNRISV